MTDFEAVVRDCLVEVGVQISECRFGVYDCSNVDAVHEAGIYVFFDESEAYYVGESSDIARRLTKEHCSAHIGGSEGIVRFLMNYLEDICENKNAWTGLNPKSREDFVEGLVRERIDKLKIYAVTCNTLRNEGRVKNRLRIELEKCLKARLRPKLN
ncbi:hypothetical protein GCM10007981_02660 [Thermocladium modestius]|uniref:GIY-YIG domain-containing protein n=1 Tax=Thermocladium modestius TaxID=62609 RepID=A0A830GSR7_9CREN|nr:GIY-YIG nuclease family protein [Thermocladium modestius]GGP19346.1 hypothetical protein GCM10007981_02660 [Thermocladium modestius]